MGILQEAKTNPKLSQIFDFVRKQISDAEDQEQELKEPPSSILKKDLMAAIIVLYNENKSIKSANVDSSQMSQRFGFSSKFSSTNKICPQHKYKTCKIEGCQFEHPQKCEKLIANGLSKFNDQGCDTKCGLYHPWVCHSSMKYKECKNMKCKRVHLPGTRRIKEHAKDQAGQNWGGFYPNPWNMYQPWHSYTYPAHQQRTGGHGQRRRTSGHTKGTHHGSGQLTNSAENASSAFLTQGFQSVTESLRELIQTQQQLSQQLSNRMD